MNLLPAILIALPIYLGMSAATAAAAAAQPDAPVIGGMPAPAYLAIPDFRACLAAQDAGGFDTWCMPDKKPAPCPAESWQKLLELPPGQRVEACRMPRQPSGTSLMNQLMH